MTVRVAIHGAGRTVTGSCLLFEAGGRRVLVDCGMFQGSKTLKELNYGRFPFDPAGLDAVVLTHAHIDHSGLLPKLVRAGFKGTIHATPATRDLCSAMLPDSGHIQEFEVEVLNRRNARRGRAEVRPIYTAEDAVATMRSFGAERLGHWFTPAHGVRARFWNAGHILGSASAEFEFAGEGKDGAALTVLVSGDIGPRSAALEPAARGPNGLDYVFCESTYGDTDRPPISVQSRRAMLAGEVLAGLDDHGVLLMPAFAVERTQELVVDLIALMESGEIPTCPVFIDSPLAIRATEMFVRNAGELPRDVDIAHVMRSANLHFTQSEAESRGISAYSGFRIILAGSGMCDAGRIRHHLKQWLWKPAATVLLTGYQAHGTLGRLLQEGAKEVRIQGDEITVRARIRMTDAYSGHADASELAAWVKARERIGSGLFLVHGEAGAMAALATRLRGALPDGTALVQPLLDEVYDLAPAGPAVRPPSGPRRIAPEAVGHLDWHNDRARLLLDIGSRLDAAPDDAARGAILRRLREALQTAAAVRT